MMDWLWFALLGTLAAWIAGRMMRGNGFGFAGDVVVGIIGAMLGGYLFSQAGLTARLFAAFAGALLLLFVVRLFTGRRNGRQLWS